MVIVSYTHFNVEYGSGIFDISFKNTADLPTITQTQAYFKNNPFYRVRPNKGAILIFQFLKDKYKQIKLIERDKERKKYRFFPNYQALSLLENLINLYYLPFLFGFYPNNEIKVQRTNSTTNRKGLVKQLSLFGSENDIKN